jgi:alpha-L-arabinofuranosidase
MKVIRPLLLSVACLFPVLSVLAQPEGQIRVDASMVENRISPWLYGSCIEDVNHEIYGGLYAQLIFGESFEEPDAIYGLDAYSRYEGVWFAYGETLAVSASRGGKLICEDMEIADGSVEVEVKMDNDRGNMTGILFRVSEEGIGQDNFCGYSVALANTGKKVVIGKHRHNTKIIKELYFDFDPYVWNRLKVVMKAARFELFFNGKSVFSYEDGNDPLLKGKIGLRNQVADACYRNVAVDTGDGKIIAISNKSVKGESVSCLWDTMITGTARAIFMHDSVAAFNGKFSQYIHFKDGNGTAGIANMGLNRWGIAVRKEQTMTGSLWLKGSGNITVALQNADGTKQYASMKTGNLTERWIRYEFALTPDTDDPGARFVVHLDSPGMAWIDQVSLMPAENALYEGYPFRADIVKAMKNQGLTFLRYGGTMVNVPGYRFKNMTGNRDCRPPYKGHWYAYSTNGFGIEEFLQLCEAAGFVPSFAVNIDEDPQDMADMIEYLNGSATSKWGAMRAANGHPAPYNVKYIEIGNEEVIRNSHEGAYHRYIERFNMLSAAMKAKDPSLSLIISVEWKPDLTDWMELVFRALDGKADYWDYHPWTDPLHAGKTVDAMLKQMKELFLKWNPLTTMKCVIFEENGNTHNLQRALAHAAVQNSARRHGDFVLATCAANALQPWRQNDNSWNQGQIFFTPAQVWCMPPYYTQQMAAANHQPLLVNSTTDTGLDVVAACNEKGDRLVLYVCNITPQTVPAKIEISGFGEVKKAKVLTLSGKLTGVNTPEEPERIVPIERTIEIAAGQEYKFLPFSYTVLVYSK